MINPIPIPSNLDIARSLYMRLKYDSKHWLISTPHVLYHLCNLHPTYISFHGYFTAISPILDHVALDLICLFLKSISSTSDLMLSGPLISTENFIFKWEML